MHAKHVLPFLAATCMVGAFLLPGTAAAEKGAITLSEVTIVGRVQKPVAAVDVATIAPKLTLAELKQPFLDRIEEATKHDPF